MLRKGNHGSRKKDGNSRNEKISLYWWEVKGGRTSPSQHPELHMCSGCWPAPAG